LHELKPIELKLIELKKIELKITELKMIELEIIEFTVQEHQEALLQHTGQLLHSSFQCLSWSL